MHYNNGVMRLRILHITETGKSHMDPFQQISHICRTAYNSGLLSPYHPCPGLLYPSFKASTIQTCFFSPLTQPFWPQRRLSCSLAEHQRGGRRRPLCRSNLWQFLHADAATSGTRLSSTGRNGANTARQSVRGRSNKRQDLGSGLAFSWPNPQ